MQRALSHDRITNVNVFQQPSFVAKAIAPQRSLILALGLFVAAMSGAATIYACGYLTRRFQSLAELAERLGLPVIGSLPLPSLHTAAM
jgi:capsular polysaccharide biosynthesis protein